jgi:hypothetical protein
MWEVTPQRCSSPRLAQKVGMQVGQQPTLRQVERLTLAASETAAGRQSLASQACHRRTWS